MTPGSIIIMMTSATQYVVIVGLHCAFRPIMLYILEKYVHIGPKNLFQDTHVPIGQQSKHLIEIFPTIGGDDGKPVEF